VKLAVVPWFSAGASLTFLIMGIYYMRSARREVADSFERKIPVMAACLSIILGISMGGLLIVLPLPLYWEIARPMVYIAAVILNVGSGTYNLLHRRKLAVDLLQKRTITMAGWLSIVIGVLIGVFVILPR